MRAIGFCHLLLQSRALVSRLFSTRSLPRARGLFRFPRSLPVPFFRRTEHSSTQRFHAAVVTVVDDRFSVSGFPAITEPLSRLSSLFDVPACESLRSGPHTEVAPSSLPDAIREDLAALQTGTTSIERCISSASVLRRLPRATGVDQCREPVRLSLVLPPTCRLTAPFRRCDIALRLQTRLPRLGPRTHPLV
jgi:hypothetical protein